VLDTPRRVLDIPPLFVYHHLDPLAFVSWQDMAAVGKDRAAGGKDRVAVGKDRVAVGTDRAAVGEGRAAGGKNRAAVDKDRVAVGKNGAATTWTPLPLWDPPRGRPILSKMRMSRTGNFPQQIFPHGFVIASKDRGAVGGAPRNPYMCLIAWRDHQTILARPYTEYDVLKLQAMAPIPRLLMTLRLYYPRTSPLPR